jgi:hypothetical integral membrane protein (TIGR02206 family)
MTHLPYVMSQRGASRATKEPQRKASVRAPHRRGFMNQPFVFLGPSHVTAIALTFAAPAALSTLSRRRHDLDRAIRVALAFVIALNWALWMGLLYAKGWLNIGNEIPLNLCDWATVATFVALLWPGQLSFEVAYFWALCGTLQALITPDCKYEFPDAQFTLFFVYHGGIIAAVLYLVFGRGMRPYLSSFPRVLGWTALYAAVAGAADAMLGTDYGFLRAKPADHWTFLDLLSPWPWYLPELALAALAFMSVFYAPFFIRDRLARA